MPKVAQAHLDARRQQIVDAARRRFASDGFARTSLADIVDESGLSNGAIYRYFASKDDIVAAVCEQAASTLPSKLDAPAIAEALEEVRILARETGHARLVTQIYAEAAVSPVLAERVKTQLSALRRAVAALLPDVAEDDAARIAEAFVAMCIAYNTQLALYGDVDPAPYVTALLAIIES